MTIMKERMRRAGLRGSGVLMSLSAPPERCSAVSDPLATWPMRESSASCGSRCDVVQGSRMSLAVWRIPCDMWVRSFQGVTVKAVCHLLHVN